LAAMTVANTRDNLTVWLHDPQTTKPGCNMPDLKLTEDDLAKLVDYLETLR
jgi:cytochrome c1